jgi:serine/threonine protein kinase
MNITSQEVLHNGNSVITIEQFQDLDSPVVIKRSSNSDPSRQYTKSLENEFRITNVLREIKGIRNAIEHRNNDSMPALVLEYVDGLNLKDYSADKTLDLPSKLAIAIELVRILGDVHRKTIILLNLSSENTDAGKPALHLTGTDRKDQPHCG